MGPSLRAALLALAALAAAPAIAAPFTVAPPPAWVVPIPADLARPPRLEAGGGVEYLVVEDQVRVGPGERQAFHRLVSRVISPKGIEVASEVRVDFDPQSERLVLHGVTIHRGGRRIPALRAGEVKVIQRERELDRRLYDGRRTAVLFLRDVRVGDVVETSHTIVGANPVFAGRYADRFELGYGVRVGKLGVRVLAPEGRPLAWRVHGPNAPPTVTRRGALVEYRWSREGVEAVQYEEDLPPGTSAFPWLELSEWGAWGEVVGWALPLYQPGPLSPAMEEKVAEWRALPDEGARATAALRFVQDEIRYLGMEMGPGSHRPNAPAEVFARRFGDCKDKALLLVALLRALGVEAAPALVDADDHAAVADRLPSPFAFDHVIVRARLAGAERWLEPTRSLEHTPAQLLSPPPYAAALVLAPGVEAIGPIPAPPPSRLDVRDTWKVARFGAPIRFEVVTRYEGTRALWMRHELAEGSLADLQRRYLNFYGHRDPKIRAAAPLQVEDDPGADRVTITERYELPAAAEGAERGFPATSIREQLGDPATALRRLPLRLRHPTVVTERLRIELPGRPDLDPEREVVASGGARLAYAATIEPSAAVLDFEYRSLAGAVPPEQVANHLDALRRMRELSLPSFPLAVRRAPPPSPPTRWTEVAAILAILGAVAGYGLLARPGLRRAWAERRQSRRRRAFAAKLEHALGETALAPIPVRSAVEIPARLSGLRCACGALLGVPGGEGERLLCGGREVVVHALACARCGAERRAYFGLDG